MNATTSTTYRCSVCGTIQTTDEDLAVCNQTSACGLLFDDEIVRDTRPAAPVARFLKFRLLNAPEGGFMAGDDRSYEVLYRGQYLGDIDPEWLVPARAGDEPVRGFSFRSADGKLQGEGKTRAAAVTAAFTS